MREYFIVGPDIEFTLLAFGISIKRGGKSAIASSHFTLEPINCFMRALCKDRILAALIGKCEQLQKQGIVVEHFLEMRHKPFFIDRVTRKSTTQMVVNAALAHAFERVLNGLKEQRIMCAQPC